MSAIGQKPPTVSSWQDALKVEIVSAAMSSYEDAVPVPNKNDDLDKHVELIQWTLAWSFTMMGKKPEDAKELAPLTPSRVREVLHQGFHAAIKKIVREKLKWETMLYDNQLLILRLEKMAKEEDPDEIVMTLEDDYAVVDIKPSEVDSNSVDLSKEKIALLKSWIKNPALVLQVDADKEH